jgi:uncharacterized protein
MTNALAHATSPYLLQHADNPVHWYPWSQEALTLARESGRPILLSIGYSACHWCHVMAHESFEDEATAALMNRLFINIKVDREERPDLDRIYQLAHQLLARRPGGWPLTMFLTHDDHMPFFGGTYFPRESRYGLPGFQQLLTHVDRLYRERMPELRDQNERMRQALEGFVQPQAALVGDLNESALLGATTELAENFDQRFGGFGASPKFPHPSYLARLLHEHQRLARATAAGQAAGRASARHPTDEAAGRAPSRHHPDEAARARQALDMALLTLTRMAEGGLFDQLGGGFARYSVDAEWGIPHFEKMLYDNGPLLALYSAAWALTDDPLLAHAADETARWLLTDMRLTDGGFASSRDADSEGHEGRFYVWDAAEVQQLLPPADFPLFAARYGLDGAPNFEGAWHLVVRTPVPAIAEKHGRTVAQVEEQLAACREQLLAVRARRIAPARDDKVLTAWNALLISGLSAHGRWRGTGASASIEAARGGLAFLQRELWRDGRLFASWKDGQAGVPGYLDDHAFLLAAVLDLATVAPEAADFAFAAALADALLEHFEDQDAGGFHFTAHDHEQIIQRPRSFTDDAIPSGNGVAAQSLARLGHWLGEARWIAAAERVVRAAGRDLERMPSAHCSLLDALELLLEAPEVVVLRGPDPAELEAWRRRASGQRLWGRDVLALPSVWEGLPGSLGAYPAVQQTTAWVCRGTRCSAPVTDLESLVDLLDGAGGRERLAAVHD